LVGFVASNKFLEIFFDRGAELGSILPVGVKSRLPFLGKTAALHSGFLGIIESSSKPGNHPLPLSSTYSSQLATIDF
jgi:hypothetical protein